MAHYSKSLYNAPMKIVVCVKQVPDTGDVRIDPKTNTLVRKGVESVLNPLDTFALEEAVRIRESNGGEVVALSMGPATNCGKKET